MQNPTHLNLINEVDAAPIEWAKILTTGIPVLCRNAKRGPNAWFCYHYAGTVTVGKEAVNADGLCEACEIALPPYEEAPSFMKGDDD